MSLPPPPPELVDFDEARMPAGAGVLIALCCSVLFWSLVLVLALIFHD
ncbi:MAG: hypothetical protein ABW023_09940 [Sphingomonas sp.]